MIKTLKNADSDLEVLANLALVMWNKHSVHDLIDEFSKKMAEGKTQFFLKYENGEPVSFAQCQLRYDYVEGTKTSPVGYLEGIFVKQEYRRKGYAKELLRACEAWAKGKGCTEFASDCEINNEESLRFHISMGFTEANRIICFTKAL